ncbi:MAG TPA: DUF4097 family beta strand repeat-containing protein [Rhodanobacteraceae bacterium]|jgi:hypothetical protein|nr:DUF4097 family beta strand repeat-containing protein [Rhodanobacteraceae bacterium]
MHKSIPLLAGASLLAVAFAAGAAEQCRYSAPRNAELDATGLKSLEVDLGRSDLSIRGERGLTKITVRGTACASNEAWLKDVKVETARHGDTASITADSGEHGIVLSFFGGSYAYLKLDVRVPQSLAVKLKQGSGDASAGSLAALDATLGSGDLKVDGVAGEFGLSVGSGDVESSHVGSLNLSSVGSGDVDVDGVNGDARVGSVGSGDLGLRNVKGNVSIGSISSGDAKLSGIGGSLTVGSVSSGDFDVRNVKGEVSIRSVASGDVDIERAGGNVRVDNIGSGDFDADGVGGDLSIGAVGSGDVRHRGVKGKVSVPRNDD